ncbi:FlgD immunoglobulin-like domain containing protein [Candidatus Latescibacterota bacterium]
MKKLTRIILTSCAAVGLPLLVLASVQYRMPHHVTGSGGDTLSGGSYRIRGTVGQPLIGRVSGVSAGIKGGYWHVAGTTTTPDSFELEPPTNVQLADVPGDHGHALSLTWTASTSADVLSYRIYRSRNGTSTDSRFLSDFGTMEALNLWEETSTVFIGTVPADMTEYTDEAVPLPGETYYYWIQAAGQGGVSEKVAAQTGGPVFVENMPGGFSVYPAYPNPFNPHTTIDYSLQENAHIRLAVYDTQGKRVRVLEDGYRNSGYHSSQWDGRDESGKPVASGFYFYRFETGKHMMLGKMVLMK